MPPFFTHCFFFCSDRWRETSSYSRHHCRSIWLSLSAFSGGLFYSLINWDLTSPPCLHLSVSLHDNQLTHVQTPSGNPPSTPKETETMDTEAIRLNPRLQQRNFPPPVLPSRKELTSCGYIFISCSGLFILVGGVYVELSFCLLHCQ